MVPSHLPESMTNHQRCCGFHLRVDLKENAHDISHQNALELPQWVPVTFPRGHDMEKSQELGDLPWYNWGRELKDPGSNTSHGMPLYGAMMTSSYGKDFRITGPLWGNLLITDGFLSQKASNADLLCFFCVNLNKLLTSGQWFKMLCHSCRITAILCFMSLSREVLNLTFLDK